MAKIGNCPDPTHSGACVPRMEYAIQHCKSSGFVTKKGPVVTFRGAAPDPGDAPQYAKQKGTQNVRFFHFRGFCVPKGRRMLIKDRIFTGLGSVALSHR